VILGRMKNDFPPTTDWALASLDNFLHWLAPFSLLPPTRELATLSFDIRETARLMTELVQSQILEDETQVVKDKEPLPSALPTVYPKRVTRRSVVTKEPSEASNALDESPPTPDTFGHTIRVKRSTRAAKSSGDLEEMETTPFPTKVRFGFFVF
jgi:hypothetical protein